MLYLVANTLDHGEKSRGDVRDVLPQGTLEVAARLRFWIVENAKSARAFLNRVNAVVPLAVPLREMNIVELSRQAHKKGDHAQPADAATRRLLQPALDGHDVGLLSEAGMPAVADPGTAVVRAAHELDIGVVPLVGPSALLLAVAASGMNGQNFAFVGYLPQDAAARSQRIRELERTARRTGQTQLFIETPYRNAALLDALLATLTDSTRLSLHSGLTLAEARSRTATAAQWRAKERAAHVAFLQHPTLFAVGI